MPLVISNKIHLGATLKILTAQCRHMSTGVDSQLLQQKPPNVLVRMAEQKSHQKSNFQFRAVLLCQHPRTRSLSQGQIYQLLPSGCKLYFRIAPLAGEG